jgi:glycosyltransferase involved in cell wall biosynthesis
MPSFAIIVPCYNEEKRIQPSLFILFAHLHKAVKFFFVNDGSKDETANIIKKMAAECENIELINLSKNYGKGEAVRQGLVSALSKNNFDYIGYLDADLSTSLEEYYELCIYAYQNNADFIFGSRIKKLGSIINRSFIRHVSGRILVTFIDKKFRLGYYDTQCGAKLFKSQVLCNIIQQPFLTRWFFDIEIFLRLKAENKKYYGIEYPLKIWNNITGSKLNVLSFPAVCKEVFVLLSKY